MLTQKQHEVLLRPINAGRISHRSQGGKSLSYLESWDVRAHLIRVFGFANFDVTVLDYRHVADRTYAKDGKDMVEVIYTAHVQLDLRDVDGEHLATYSEVAAGSASGPENMLGDHHDNAVKTAESDALKRCAINLGSQFGLSLYDQGNVNEVVRRLVNDEEPPVAPEVVEALSRSLGATVVDESTDSVTPEGVPG